MNLVFIVIWTEKVDKCLSFNLIFFHKKAHFVFWNGHVWKDVCFFFVLVQAHYLQNRKNIELLYIEFRVQSSM